MIEAQGVPSQLEQTEVINDQRLKETDQLGLREVINALESASADRPAAIAVLLTKLKPGGEMSNLAGFAVEKQTGQTQIEVRLTKWGEETGMGKTIDEMVQDAQLFLNKVALPSGVTIHAERFDGKITDTLGQRTLSNFSTLRFLIYLQN